MDDDERDDIAAAMKEDDRIRWNAVSELKRALEAFDGSATALAKAAGVSTSTITRPLKDPRSASLPKWATIVKILSAAGLTPQSYGGPTTARNSLQIIEVVGEIRPGVWFEDIDDRDYGPNLLIALDHLKVVGSLSAYIVGPEGLPYEPGTRAIVDSGRSPESGDTVIFRRVMGDLIETFAALYQYERARHIYYKTGVDGKSTRQESVPFSTTHPDVGVMIGPVVATVWVKS